MYYLTRAQVIDAVARLCQFEGHGHRLDGTYAPVWGWIGNTRTFNVERIEEGSGYEVAYQEFANGGELDVLAPGERIGVWTDETGDVIIDHVLHVSGITRSGAALDIGRTFKQESIWDWASETAIPTTVPATALI